MVGTTTAVTTNRIPPQTLTLWQWAARSGPVLTGALAALQAGGTLSPTVHAELIEQGRVLAGTRQNGLSTSDQLILRDFVRQTRVNQQPNTQEWTQGQLHATLDVVKRLLPAIPSGFGGALLAQAADDRLPREALPKDKDARRIVFYDPSLPSWAGGTTSVGSAVLRIGADRVKTLLGFQDKNTLYSHSGLLRLLNTQYVNFDAVPQSLDEMRRQMQEARPDKFARARSFLQGQIARMTPKLKALVTETGKKLSEAQQGHQAAFQKVLDCLKDTGALKNLITAAKGRAEALQELNVAITESEYLSSRGIGPAAYRIHAYRRRAEQATSEKGYRYWLRKSLLLEKRFIEESYRNVVTAMIEMGRPETEWAPYDARAKKAEEVMARVVKTLYHGDEAALKRDIKEAGIHWESAGDFLLPEGDEALFTESDQKWLQLFRDEVFPSSLEWDAEGLARVRDTEQRYERARLAHGQATREFHLKSGFAIHEWSEKEREVNVLRDELDFALQRKRLGWVWKKLEDHRRKGNISEAKLETFEHDRQEFLKMVSDYVAKHPKHMEYMKGFFDGTDVNARVHALSSKDKGEVASLFQLQLFLEEMYQEYGMPTTPPVLSFKSVVATGHVQQALSSGQKHPETLDGFFASLVDATDIVNKQVGFRFGEFKFAGRRSPHPAAISVIANVAFSSRVELNRRVANTYYGLGPFGPLLFRKPPHPLVYNLAGARQTFPDADQSILDPWVEPGAWDMPHNGIDEFRAIEGGMDPEGMIWFTGAQAGANQVFILGDVIMATAPFGNVDRAKGSAGIYGPWRVSVEADSGVSFFGEGARRSVPATAHPLGDFSWDKKRPLEENLLGHFLPIAPGIRATSGMNYKLMSMVNDDAREAGLISLVEGALKTFPDQESFEAADDLLTTIFSSDFAENAFEPTWPLDEVKTAAQGADLLTKYFSRAIGLNFAKDSNRRIAVVPPFSSLGLIETDELVAAAEQANSALFAPENGQPLTAREQYIRTIQYHVNTWRFLELFYKMQMDTTKLPGMTLAQTDLLERAEQMEDDGERDHELRDGLMDPFIERAKRSPIWGKPLRPDPNLSRVGGAT